MRRLLSTLAVGILLLGASTAVPVGALIGVLYVDTDATGANNGTSWDDAFTSLTDALALAGSGDEVWVAEGTYHPHPSDRAVSFPLVSGVKIIGGFDGTETSSAEADPSAHSTILSGDLSGNDSGAIEFDNPTRSDNSLRIFDGTVLTDATELIGLTISDGNANGDTAETSGAPALSLVTADEPLTLRSVSVKNNSSNDGRSGAIYVGFAPLTIIDSVFDTNVTNASGGALYCLRCDLVVTGSTFTNNRAGFPSGNGGAIRMFRSSGTIMNSQFVGNVAAFGGVINITTSVGSVNVVIANVLAVRNQAIRGLGSFLIASSGDAAAGTTIEILSSTIIEPVGVVSAVGTGALYIVGTTPETTVANSIIWDDVERAIPTQSSEDRISVANSIMSGSGGSANWNTSNGTDLGGNLDVEPQFQDAGAGDYTPTGPATEAGDNARLPADVLDLDMDGNTTEPIPVDFLGADRSVGVTDMGAIENSSDLGGPVLTFTNPFVSQDSPMQITGTVTDPGGVDRVDWVAVDIGNAGATGTDPSTISVWNGSEWTDALGLVAPLQADVSGEDWKIDWDPVPGGSGSYAVGLQAFDNDGNKSPADRDYQAILVISDLTAPQVPQVTVDYHQGGQLSFSGTASEDVAVRKVRLIVRHVDSNSYWNGQSWIPAAQAASVPTVLLTADLSEPLASDPTFQYSFTPNRAGEFQSLVWAQNGAYRYSQAASTGIVVPDN